MAEGHVVRRNAERAHAALAGERLVVVRWRSRRVDTADPGPLVGQRVVEVGFAGKNHLFRLEAGTFRVHLMMFGSTQIGARDAPMRKPAQRVRLHLETADHRVLVFSAPVVEWYAAGAAIPAVERLGPDALKRPFDGARFQRLLAASPQATVAEALLDPSVVAGVGNIYKSEALWRTQVHPERAPASLGRDELRALAKVVPALMMEGYRALADPATRRDHLRVYRRSGRPCPRCATRLAGGRTGGRLSYWCPACQPPQVRVGEAP